MVGSFAFISDEKTIKRNKIKIDFFQFNLNLGINKINVVEFLFKSGRTIYKHFSNHLLSFSFLAALPWALNTRVIVRAIVSIKASIKRWVEIFIS